MSIEDISVPVEGVNWQDCLQHWSWILKKCPEFNILLATKFGEIFVTASDGAVWFLSTSNGSFERIAESQDQLVEILEHQESYDYYFMPQVLAVLEHSLGHLESGYCYGFHVPMVFEESSLDPSNFKIIRIENYLAGLGDMLGKLQGVPNGQEVTFKAVD